MGRHRFPVVTQGHPAAGRGIPGAPGDFSRSPPLARGYFLVAKSSLTRAPSFSSTWFQYQ